MKNWPSWYKLSSKTRLLVKVAAEGEPVILTGPPGTGKTAFAEALSEYLDADYLYYLCSNWTTEEDLFVKLDPAAVALTMTGKSEFAEKSYNPGVLMKAVLTSQEHKVVIVIDELDKAQEHVDNLLLHFLDKFEAPDQYGNMVQAQRENVHVVITSNKLRELSLPLYRRCFRFEMSYLEPEVELEILRQKTGTNVQVIKSLLKFVNAIRKSEIKSVSLNEMLKFLTMLKHADSRADIQVLIEGYIVDDADVHDEVKKLSKMMWKALKNN